MSETYHVLPRPTARLWCQLVQREIVKLFTALLSLREMNPRRFPLLKSRLTLGSSLAWCQHIHYCDSQLAIKRLQRTPSIAAATSSLNSSARCREEKCGFDLSAHAGQPRAQPGGCPRSQRTCRTDRGPRDGDCQDQGSVFVALDANGSFPRSREDATKLTSIIPLSNPHTRTTGFHIVGRWTPRRVRFGLSFEKRCFAAAEGWGSMKNGMPALSSRVCN